MKKIYRTMIPWILRTYWSGDYRGPAIASDTLANAAADRIIELESAITEYLEVLDSSNWTEEDHALSRVVSVVEKKDTNLEEGKLLSDRVKLFHGRGNE